MSRAEMTGYFKKVQLHFYVNGGRERGGVFMEPEAVKLAQTIVEDLGGWTGSTYLQVHLIVSISTRVK